MSGGGCATADRATYWDCLAVHAQPFNHGGSHTGRRGLDMSWITIFCSMIAASCLTVAVVHLFVWLRARDARPNLLLSSCAFSLRSWSRSTSR